MTTNTDHNAPVTLDDPRLTAYVLGELDAPEVVAVEAALRGDAGLRDAVAGIRATCDLVATSLSNGAADAPKMLPAQARGRILSAAQLAPVGFETDAQAALRRRSAASLIGRTLRRVVGVAAVIGVFYLIGVAGWKDTHPQASTVLASRDNTSWLQNIILTPEQRVERLWDGPGLITVDNGTNSIPHAEILDGQQSVVLPRFWNSTVTPELVGKESPSGGQIAGDFRVDGTSYALFGGEGAGAGSDEGAGDVSGDGRPGVLVERSRNDRELKAREFNARESEAKNTRLFTSSKQPPKADANASAPSRAPAKSDASASAKTPPKPAAKAAPPKVSRDTEAALKAMGYIEDEDDDDARAAAPAANAKIANQQASKRKLSKEEEESLKSLAYLGDSDASVAGHGESKSKSKAGRKEGAAEKSSKADRDAHKSTSTDGHRPQTLQPQSLEDALSSLLQQEQRAYRGTDDQASRFLQSEQIVSVTSVGGTDSNRDADADDGAFLDGVELDMAVDGTDGGEVSIANSAYPDLTVDGYGDRSLHGRRAQSKKVKQKYAVDTVGYLEDEPGDNSETNRSPDFLAQLDAETYAAIHDNAFTSVSEQPQSTFSIDTDSAGYSNVRRFLLSNQLPPPEAVRIEEMVNYFNYDYPLPQKGEPFSVTVEMSEAPWQPEHRLMRVGLKAFEVRKEDRPPVNLVFLVDNSGSMQDSSAKLPLVKDSLKLLLEQLWAEDQVGIVTYTDKARVALPSTPGSRFEDIIRAIDSMTASGSTNGGAGLREAYVMARENFVNDGVNRVMICTDGDFNVGETDNSDLAQLITEEAKSGVFLSVLGFGTGNLKDDKLEAIADKGNGHYAYIDDIIEAKRVLGDQSGATLQTVAKDVKIQVEFNPAYVQSYRLIGYENRMLEAKDFADDKKDAGEIGAGHTVTALYEIVSAGGALQPTGADAVAASVAAGDESDAAPVDGVDEANADALDDATAEVLIDSAAPDPRFANMEFEPAADDGDADAEGDVDVAPDIDIEGRPEAYDYSNQNGHIVATPRPGLYHIGSPPSEIMTVRVRFKWPAEDTSNLMEIPVADGGLTLAEASDDLRFAAAVASFGMWLRHSPYAGEWSIDAAAELAESGVGADESGYRREFVDLVRRAADLAAAAAR